MFNFSGSLLLLIAILYVNRVQSDFGWKEVYDVYNSCAENITMEECFSMKLVSGLEELQHQEKISVLGGLELVKNTTEDKSSVYQDTRQDSTPRTQEEQGVQLVLKKIEKLLQTHSLQLSLQEERGQSSKLKKFLLPFLLGVVMKLATLLPMVLGVFKALAVKALLASKAALVLSLFLAFKALLHHKKQRQNNHKEHVYYVYSDPGGYGNIDASSNLLGGEDNKYEDHTLIDSPSTPTDFTAGVYGRSLQSEGVKNSKVATEFSNLLRDNFHKARTILA